MSRSEEAVVKEWLMVIKVACDADSPFAGMVDLSGIFSLPITTQRKIYDAMSQDERDRMKSLYAPKDGSAS
jgi:hypothetical protein